MADQKLSLIAGSGGGLPMLAPDLTWPSSISNNVDFVTVSFNPQGALTTALSLTGKFSIDVLALQSFTQEPITIKLTIDGVVIWNDSYTVTDADVFLLGRPGFSTPSRIQCNSSLLLEVETATDTSVDLTYIARPIL